MVVRVPVGDDMVDVSVVSWNSWPHLRETLPALIAQDYPSYRVVVVDNASSDETAEAVEAHFPDVTVIRSDRNGGYAAGNNVCIARSTSKYVAVVNPDARPETGWLRALVRALEDDPSAALATSKVLLASDPGRVNACGLDVHLSGIAFCRGLRQEQHQYVTTAPGAAVSGAAFVARRDVLEEIGALDERFFMYMEDTDLSMRARLAGYGVIMTPRSRVAHDYTLTVPPQKFFYLERNRAFMLINVFRWRTLALLTPALVLAEVGVWWYAARSGRPWLWAKARACASVVACIPAMLRRRGEVQKLRRVRDAALIAQLTPTLREIEGVRGAPLRLANRCFAAYAALLRQLVRW